MYCTTATHSRKPERGDIVSGSVYIPGVCPGDSPIANYHFLGVYCGEAADGFMTRPFWRSARFRPDTIFTRAVHVNQSRSPQAWHYSLLMAEVNPGTHPARWSVTDDQCVGSDATRLGSQAQDANVGSVISLSYDGKPTARAELYANGNLAIYQDGRLAWHGNLRAGLAEQAHSRLTDALHRAASGAQPVAL